MNFVQHRSNNRVIGAPRNWNQTLLPCHALPVTDVAVPLSELDSVITRQDCMAGIKSYWRPTPEELQQLNNGALVTLLVVNSSMPPVAMTVEDV